MPAPRRSPHSANIYSQNRRSDLDVARPAMAPFLITVLTPVLSGDKNVTLASHTRGRLLADRPCLFSVLRPPVGVRSRRPRGEYDRSQHVADVEGAHAGFRREGGAGAVISRADRRQPHAA